MQLFQKRSWGLNLLSFACNFRMSTILIVDVLQYFDSVVERPDAFPETIVAVFPPSDFSASEHRRADQNQFYQTSDSTISSIKCVMSTILFLAVVAIIIVVAFVKNPGM